MLIASDAQRSADAKPKTKKPTKRPWPKPNIHVRGRKVTEHPDHTTLPSKSTPVGNFAFRSGATKSPWIRGRFPVRAVVFAGFSSPFGLSAK
jgi:hypothetical protein